MSINDNTLVHFNFRRIHIIILPTIGFGGNGNVTVVDKLTGKGDTITVDEAINFLEKKNKKGGSGGTETPIHKVELA